MIPIRELKKLVSARLKDAEVLYKGKRYDGAVYLCGYAVELILKAKICKTLRWPEFPSILNNALTLDFAETRTK